MNTWSTIALKPASSKALRAPDIFAHRISPVVPSTRATRNNAPSVGWTMTAPPRVGRRDQHRHGDIFGDLTVGLPERIHPPHHRRIGTGLIRNGNHVGSKCVAVVLHIRLGHFGHAKHLGVRTHEGALQLGGLKAQIGQRMVVALEHNLDDLNGRWHDGDRRDLRPSVRSQQETARPPAAPINSRWSRLTAAGPLEEFGSALPYGRPDRGVRVGGTHEEAQFAALLAQPCTSDFSLSLHDCTQVVNACRSC
ncbi:MAG: hypothetical protein H6Q33_3284 [Deltaproteobacteria bacterium]|nr:hypothetical protein [Deltaproteobacteria bacterium]